MILTIWRHGEAEEGAIDRRRKLTNAGSDDIGFGCRQLHKACINKGVPQPDTILYSPWVRAVQTAEIVAAAYTHADATAETALQPVSDVTSVDVALSGIVESSPRAGHVLVVSHQPLVSRLVDYYLGDGAAVPSLSPGGLVTVSLDVVAPACGSLLFWALPPDYETCA
jgi:phosphohistidine phosphatase